MATTVGTPTQRPASKGLLALSRRFKQGYKLERGSGGHWRVRDREGRFVEHEGRPITTSGNPTGGVLKALERQLEEALVFRGAKQRPISDEGMQRRQRASRDMLAKRQAGRQQEANALRERYAAAFAHMGGLNVPGLSGDLGRVGALLLRDTPSQNGKRLKTPDLLVGSAHRMLHGAWVEPEYADVWVDLVEHLEKSPDVVGEWYSLVREARGLPADSVEVRLREDAQDEWPFRVELLPLDALLVDHDHYQRPVGWPFVRREAARFDPSLVGTIDVAQRSPSSFAVLDGQQRAEIVRLVGKQSIWCSIYVGLDVASEARFFLRKNRDRKTMHPYYTFRAALVSRDDDSVAINEIVERHGYKLAIGAPRADRTANISAIAAVTTAYGRKLPDGHDTLDPTLSILKRSTFGRDHGQDSVLIRGVSAALLERPDSDDKQLAKIIASLGPDLILGRARDLVRSARISSEQGVVRVLLSEHDRETRTRKSAA